MQISIMALLIRGAIAASLAVAVIAQPYCIANKSATAIPPEVMGAGLIDICTSPLHPQWIGATLVISATQVDVFQTATAVVIDRLCIDSFTETTPGGVTDYRQFQLTTTNEFFLPVLCFTVKLTPNATDPTAPALLQFSFADDKSQKCGTTWDTSVTKYVVNASQPQRDCPFDGIEGTGLEGWGEVGPANQLYYQGFAQNGYWYSPFGRDNHWTSTVCVSEVRLAGNSNPPEYILVADGATAGSTCFDLGCCVRAAVLLDDAEAYIKAGPSKLVTDCPTSILGATVIANWRAGDPSPYQPSPAASVTGTASNTPTGSVTPSQTPTASITSSIPPSSTSSRSPYPQSDALPGSAIGGIVAGSVSGGALLGVGVLGALLYRRWSLNAPEKQRLLGSAA